MSLSRELSSVQQLHDRYREVRAWSETICAPLAPEDCVIQSMPDVSPTRWHLAHTTWFFETFVLSRATPDYQPCRAEFEYLFNSYYNSVGRQFPRPQRGLLSRPTVAEVWAYRRQVDQRIGELLEGVEADGERCGQLLPVIELGLQHEQQHQELMLTDIKHVLAQNPLYPVYRESELLQTSVAGVRRGNGTAQISYGEGLVKIGHSGPGFVFDNETPRHRQFVESFRLADRLVTAGQYVEFLKDDGYRRPELWLSAGWQTVLDAGWQVPLYWVQRGEDWWQFTLSGLRPLDPLEPVCHVSYYEADAFARWCGSRLATEAEWEVAAGELPIEGNFVESERFHPAPVTGASSSVAPDQLFGDVWEWTSSDYSAYPGFRPLDGALGEYNGKFMSGQYVLRGGSCVTPRSHIRATYRNFFPPDARWQFSGFRLAE